MKERERTKDTMMKNPIESGNTLKPDPILDL